MQVAHAKILIVDDAPDFCESLAWLLNDDGYMCRVAANGQQAIDMLAKEKSHLILLDWEMPVMNGAAFLKHRGLRSDLLRIPVLVLSAASDIEKSTASFEASFLQKPLDYVRLLSTIKSLLTKLGIETAVHLARPLPAKSCTCHSRNQTYFLTRVKRVDSAVSLGEPFSRPAPIRDIMKSNVLGGSHVWSDDESNPHVIEQDGKTYHHQRCTRCGRDFAHEVPNGDWQAAYLGAFRIDLLVQDVTEQWINEECPGRILAEDFAQRLLNNS